MKFSFLIIHTVGEDFDELHEHGLITITLHWRKVDKSDNHCEVAMWISQAFYSQVVSAQPILAIDYFKARRNYFLINRFYWFQMQWKSPTMSIYHLSTHLFTSIYLHIYIYMEWDLNIVSHNHDLIQFRTLISLLFLIVDEYHKWVQRLVTIMK